MSDQPKNRPWFQFPLLALVWCATGSLFGSGTAGWLLAARAAEPANTQPAYPLWDGQESIEQYAQRVNLPPTKTLELGGGVTLELVLIPAGKFVMGTPEPKPVDEDGFRKKIVVGQAVFAVGVAVLLVLIGTVIFRAIRQRRRPQYSLARFMVMIVAAGAAVLGGMHWWFSLRALAQAQAEYKAALARYQSSYDWEKPAHNVTLTTPFYMAKFLVTQDQCQQVMSAKPSQFKGLSLPVQESWNDATELCKKVSEKTGQTVRLPTEAEWEFACRAGTTTAYYTGDADADLGRAAWYDANSGGKTHPVGQKEPNAFGLYDMHGNVWEWCRDWYGAYEPGTAVDPQGPPEGHARVLRGGSRDFEPRICRSACRLWDTPASRVGGLGFRVVVVVAPRPP
ncbi:MAG: formylglycine-generating enzyme family protein [Planctomycetota bacterium]|nr:formylglycine-generating enzyme family protein [Planctomycetota bacterium]